MAASQMLTAFALLVAVAAFGARAQQLAGPATTDGAANAKFIAMPDAAFLDVSGGSNSCPNSYPGWDYQGNDMVDFAAHSVGECCDACSGNAQCAAWTYNDQDRNGWCYLKTAAANPRQFPGATTGYITQPQPGGSGCEAGSVSKTLVDLVNQVRAQHGVAACACDSRYTCAAQGHANDIGPKNSCSHAGSDGSTPWARMDNCGAPGGYRGEIISCGTGTPQQAIEQLVNDQPHLDIMVGGDYSKCGGGMNDGYWVIDFGST
eukprot:TRINITY_DN50_c0_g2_i1.p1 TRINITY_DN50_c0_g2~~TRINITY_DN50_c0_g2_i1.p1  ORF type:complete len:262 (+),score=58.06 TRINITY_DN50_c0_g2_i1:452-1237(+)